MFDQQEEPDLNSSNMLLDFLTWNVLNVIRVELFFNLHRIGKIFMTSSIKSPRGQYAVVSLLVTVMAHIAVMFNFSWLLTIYTIYLATGMIVWLHRRVYFYHRRLDSVGVNQTITHFDSAKSASSASSSSNGTTNGSLTMKSTDKHHNSNGGISSSAEYTNSLQRQRAVAYRDFQNVLSEPRYNPREYALSLAHFAHTSKLMADKDVFDEMHFQILATRRDVINMTIRAALLSATTLLAYFK